MYENEKEQQREKNTENKNVRSRFVPAFPTALSAY